MRLLIFVALLQIFFFSATNAQNASVVARTVFPSVVLIETKGADGKSLGLGSGFFVTPNIVATNFHVIAGANRATIKIVDKDGIFPVEGVLAFDEINDIALLRVNGVTARPLTLLTETPQAGQRVFAIGNPEGLEGSISEGIVSSTQLREVGKGRALQITASISKGSSGGPVVTLNGGVVGMATAFLADGQNLNFAVPSTEISSLLRKAERSAPVALDSTPRPNSSAAPANQSLESIQEWLTSQFKDRVAVHRGRHRENLPAHIITSKITFFFIGCQAVLSSEESLKIAYLNRVSNKLGEQEFWGGIAYRMPLEDILEIEITQEGQQSDYIYSGDRNRLGFILRRPTEEGSFSEEVGVSPQKGWTQMTTTPKSVLVRTDLDLGKVTLAFRTMAEICRNR